VGVKGLMALELNVVNKKTKSLVGDM